MLCLPSLLRLTSLLIFVFLLNASPTQAVESCSKYSGDSLYPGPQFALPAKDANGELADDTCDIFDENSPLFDDFINHANVTCVDKPELVAGAINEAYAGKYNKKGGGGALLGLDKNTNFAIDPEVLNKTVNEVNNNDLIYSLKKPISMSDNLNPSDFTSECQAKGITDLTECAVSLGVDINVGNGSKINTLQASTPYQRLTSLKEQLKDAKKRANEHLTCQADDAGNTYHCGNNYDAGGGLTSVALAKTINDAIDTDPDLTEFFSLPLAKQQQLLSLTPIKSSQTYYLVIKPIPKDGLNPLEKFIIADLLNGDEPIIIRGSLPAAPAIASAAETEFRRWNQLETGNDAVTDSKKGTGSVSGTTPDQKILAKIDLLDPNCAQTFTYRQLMGAISDSRGDEDVTIGWTFDFSSDSIQDAIKKKMLVYKAWIVGPKETDLIAQFYSQNPQSPVRADYSARYIDNFTAQNKVGIPQPINTEKPDANTDPAYIPTDIVVPCPEIAPGVPPNPNSVCYKQEELVLNFSGGNAKADHKGGEFAHFYDTETKQKAYQSVNNPEYFQSTCYYQEVNKRAQSQGINLSSILGFNDSIRDLAQDCPLPLKTSSLVVPDGECLQALFEKGLCPGGSDCIDYICSKAGDAGLDCGVVAMIAANESGGLFSCDPDLKSVKHFGCDPFGVGGFDITIEAKLTCAINTLKNDINKPINEALSEYGYSEGVDSLPYSMFGLSPATTLKATNNSSILSTLRAEIYGGDTSRWWDAYCNRFPQLVAETNQTADPSEYACSKK